MGIEIDNVTPLPVKRRTTSTERVLTEAHSYACRHTRFVVDEKLEQVECADCKERLNPIYALLQLCRQETRYHELHARYQDEMKRLAERSRTKCRKCGQMTEISHA